MSQKHRTSMGMAGMLIITIIIIIMSIVIVKVSGESVEKHLLSQCMPLSETIKIENDYLQIEYPWESSSAALREANENEKKRFQESEYVEQLEKLALLLNDAAALNTENLWIDKEERLVHRANNEDELSYVVDMKRGIIGFGLEVKKETDDTIKKENLNEVIVLLEDPMQEIYQFLPAVNKIWSNHGIPILDGLQVNQEQSLSSIYDYINSFSRQVLYYHDILTVILEIEEKYMILQYDPTIQKYMSCFLFIK